MKANEDAASVQSSTLTLPPKVYEHVIDILAGNYGDIDHLAPEAQRDLRTSHLVCRAWVSRSRFHLFRKITVDSRDGFRFVATFLHASSLHADCVRVLKIRGDGSDQSWISTVPFRLPPLRCLEHLYLNAVDITQQHPRFYQALSLLRAASQASSFHLHLYPSNLTLTPTRIESLKAALGFPHTQFYGYYPVHTPMDIAVVKSWRQRLSDYTPFKTCGTLQDLVEILHNWTWPTQWWKIALQSTIQESVGELLPETHGVWEEISRVFALSTALRPGAGNVSIEFSARGLGKLFLLSVLSAFLACVHGIHSALISLSHR